MASDVPVSLGIATLAGGSRVRCGLPSWCLQAERFRSIFPKPEFDATTVMLVDDEDPPGGSMAELRLTCPSVRFLNLSAPRFHGIMAASMWVKTRHAEGGRPGVLMGKWAAFALVEYHLIFFADVDVDIIGHTKRDGLPRKPERIVEHWQLMYRQLMEVNHTVRYLSNADASSPVNTGVFVARPDRALFMDGVDVLRRQDYSKSDGWGRIGRPHVAFERAPPPRFLDGAPVLRDSPFRPSFAKAITELGNATSWWTGSFVGGEADQGFFWYMLHLKHPVGVYFRASRALVGAPEAVAPRGGGVEGAFQEGQPLGRLLQLRPRRPVLQHARPRPARPTRVPRRRGTRGRSPARRRGAAGCL